MRLGIFLTTIVCALSVHAEDTKAWSASQFIAAMKEAKPRGGTLIRVRIEQRNGGEKSTILAQIKRHEMGDGATEQLYQITYPKDRKGEALVLVTKPGAPFSAKTFVPGKGFTALTAADKRSPLFGTDLTVEDLLVDFLDWNKHEIVGGEKVRSGECTIIESNAPKTGSFPSKVKSWIDNTRFIAWRIQVFDGGNQPAREVEAEDVVRTSGGHWVPRTFSVTNLAKGTKTTVAGTGSDEDKQYAENDFSEATIAAFAQGPGIK